MKRLALALLVIAACKSKEKPAADPPPAPVAPVADASFDSASPSGTPSLRTNEAAAMPSEALVANVAKGPMRTTDGRVVWCTRGDNGMAEWAEVICHVAAPGKKTSVIPVMTYADAMAVDEGVDPAGDADAGVKAASARDRVDAALGRLVSETGAPHHTPLPAPVRCSFQGGEFVGRDDDQVGAAQGCEVGGVTAHITAPGKVTLAVADKNLLTEVLKPRARGKGDGGDDCFLEAASIELSVDATSKLAAAAIALSNPSDTCALVTEYEVRAVKLP